MADYEQIIALGVLHALQAVTLNADDVQLLKASFMASPEPEIAPRDSLRADTFASIKKLREGIAGGETEGALSKLLSSAVTSATLWLQARS